MRHSLQKNLVGAAHRVSVLAVSAENMLRAEGVEGRSCSSRAALARKTSGKRAGWGCGRARGGER